MSLYDFAGLADTETDLVGNFNDLVAQRTTALGVIADYENRLRKAISYWGGIAHNDPYYYELVSTIEAEKAKINYIDQQAANIQTQIEQARVKAQADAAAKEAERIAAAERARAEAEAKARAEAEAAKAQAQAQTPTGSIKSGGIVGTDYTNYTPVGRATETPAPTPAPAPADPILSQPLNPQPTTADIARSEREYADSIRRAAYLIERPGYDYGAGHNQRNAFFGVGENMSGLGASFDIVGAFTQAAKDASKGLKGSDILTKAGIKLPAVGNVPAPVKTFFDSLTRNLKPKAAPTTVVETAPSLPGYVAEGTFFQSHWSNYAAIALGGFLLYKIVRRKRGKR